MANPLVGSSSVPPADLLSVLPADRSALEGFPPALSRQPNPSAQSSDFSSKLQHFVGGAKEAPKSKADVKQTAPISRAANDSRIPADRSVADGARSHFKPGQEAGIRALTSRPTKPLSPASSTPGTASQSMQGGMGGSASLSKRTSEKLSETEDATSETTAESEPRETEGSDAGPTPPVPTTDAWMPLSLEKAVALMQPAAIPAIPTPEAAPQAGDGSPAQAVGTSSPGSADSQTALVRADHSADLARPTTPNGQLPPSLLEMLRPLPSSEALPSPSQPSPSSSTRPERSAAGEPLLSAASPIPPQPWLPTQAVSAPTANDSGGLSLSAMQMEPLTAAESQGLVAEKAEPDAAGPISESDPKVNPLEAGTSTARADETMRQNSEPKSGLDERAGRSASGEPMVPTESRPMSAAAASHLRDIRPSLQSRDRGDASADSIFATPLDARGAAAPVFEADNLVLAPGALQPAAAVKQEILSKVMEIRSQGSGSMNVVLRPDPNTQLSVQLRNHAGGIQVLVTMERGDATHLKGAWEGLQQSLAQQGVQLSDLEVNRAAIRESVLRAASEAGHVPDPLKPQESSQTGFAGSDAEANSGRHGRMMDWIPQDNQGASPWLDRRPARSSNADIPDAATSSSASVGPNRLARGEAVDAATSSHRQQNHLETWA